MASRSPAEQSSGPILIVGFILVLALIAAIAGWVQGGKGEPWGYALFASGVTGLFVVSAVPPLIMVIARGVSGGSAPSDSSSRQLLSQIHEHTMLSDKAKRVIYREKEIQLLRSAIEADIVKRDFDAALILCQVMADDFGYREEAEQYRQRVHAERTEQYDAQLHAAMGYFDQLLAKRDWARVHAEAAKIRRLFPDSHDLGDLDRRIAEARNGHKLHLEKLFLEAAKHEDVEKAMELLRQLDKYLTPAEADKLSEAAQGVVVKHRENLGVQFKIAVNDHAWAEAVRVGQTIVNEFPNSKMADEVRSLMEALRSRAGQELASGAAI
jgi:hypothetical protein